MWIVSIMIGEIKIYLCIYGLTKQYKIEQDNIEATGTVILNFRHAQLPSMVTFRRSYFTTLYIPINRCHALSDIFSDAQEMCT